MEKPLETIEKNNVLEKLVEKRRKEILTTLWSWEISQPRTLNRNYVLRKRNEKFKTEIKEFFALEKFLALGEFEFIEDYSAIRLYPIR